MLADRFRSGRSVYVRSDPSKGLNLESGVEVSLSVLTAGLGFLRGKQGNLR